MAAERVQRRLAAILAADVVGYSRLVGKDEEGTIARLKALREELIDPCIARHQGRIFKTTGDGILVEFPSVVDAVRCAVEVQQAMAAREAEIPEGEKIRYRIGVNLGDIVIDGDDILGDGVNIAARLEGRAEPGGICLSDDAYRQVRDKLDLAFADAGEHKFKNIARPINIWRWTGAGPSPAAMPAFELPDKPSIAVLPFENMSGDAEQEYFSDGITEDIITGLSRNRDVFVIAGNSTFTYKGAAVDARQVARELGVRYVLEGSVRKAVSRVRITAQLIDAATGNHVWAERYDRELEDIFAVQDDITQNITAAIGPELVSAEMQRARRKDPNSLDAWDCTMRARWHYARLTREDIEEARRLALRAIELDPGAAPGFSTLALTHVMDATYGWSESAPQSIADAYEAAQKAVALDNRDATADTALGTVSLLLRRFEDAVDRLETAIDLDPNNARAHGQLGGALGMAGRRDEAAERLDMALRLSPRDPFRYWWLAYRGFADFAEERHEEAAEWARKALQINPDFPSGHRLLASTYGRMGRIDEARTALEELLRIMPGVTIATTREQVPWKHPADMERYLDGLRKAGLPE